MIRQTQAHLPEGLLICAVFFGPLAFGAVEPWSEAALFCLVWGAFFFCGMSRLSECRNSIVKTLLPGIGGLVLIGLLQRLNPRSILEPSVWAPFTASAFATERSLAQWLTYGAALWCGSLVFRGQGATRRFMAAVFGLGCLVSIVGLIQLAQHRLSIYGLRSAAAGEPFGPYYNRDHAASMLLMASFCGVGLFWDGMIAYRASRGRENIFNFASAQILILFGVGVTLLGVLCALSRGALGALMVVSAALALVAAWSHRRRFLWLGAGVGLFAAAISLSPIAVRLSSEQLARSVSFRLSIYRGGAELVRDFPWLGTGLGALQQAYAPYQSASVPGTLEHIHSDWVELLIQAGVVGLGSYLAGLALFFRACLASAALAEGRASRGLACGAAAAVLAFMLHGLVDFSFQIPANALIFFLILATLGSLAESPGESKSFRRAGVLWPTNLAGALCAGAAAYYSAAPALASWRYLALSDALPPAAREASLSEIAVLDAKPRYFYELAKLSAEGAAEKAPVKAAGLRRAFAAADAAVRLDPASARYRNLQGNLLWQLERAADGNELIRGR